MLLMMGVFRSRAVLALRKRTLASSLVLLLLFWVE